MFRNSRSLCIIHSQIPSLMPPEMRKVQLRGGMPEPVLKIIGGWKKIPETYFRALGAEDA